MGSFSTEVLPEDYKRLMNGGERYVERRFYDKR